MNTNDEYLKLAAYVNISSYRTKTMLYLDGLNCDIPTNIAEGIGIRSNHISVVLRELKSKELVECINPEARKGRLYRLTTKGLEVARYMRMLGAIQIED